MSRLDDVVAEAIDELRDRLIVNGPVDYPEDEMSDIADNAIGEISALDALNSKPEFIWERTEDGERCDTVEELVSLHVYFYVLRALQTEWYGGMESEYNALYDDDDDEYDDDDDDSASEEVPAPAQLKYWDEE